MKYGVDVTDEFAVEVDLPPGAPVPMSVDLDFAAHTEDELRRLIPMLGIDAARMDPTRNIHSRYGLPVTRDGEEVARCTVTLWLKGELIEPLPKPPIPVVTQIRDEARAKAAREPEPEHA